MDSAQTRRSFFQAGASTVAGLGMATRPAAGGPRETLALSGGPKSVSFPDDRHAAVVRWPRYGPEDKKALHDLIDSNRFYQELPRFEKDIKDYTGSPYVKAHMNGTSALTSAYFALDLPPGSEVLVPSYTFFATILPMRLFQYVPVFVDIHPRTACFDLEYARRHLTKRTRAIVPMHSLGLPCDMDEILRFAKEQGLVVLEDAAQTVGASPQGKAMGTWGSMGIYSFQTSKVLPTVEGGVGLYQTREYFERAAAFGHYEDPPTFPEDSPCRKYRETGLGLKLRMHPLAAAIGRQQLKILDRRLGLVTRQVHGLNDRLAALPGLSEPYCRPDAKRVYYARNMLFFDAAKAGFPRAALVKALRAEGVRASANPYPEQHRCTVYAEEKWWHHKPEVPAHLPGCAQVNNSCLNLPLFYEEAPELIEQYVKAFEKVWAHRGELARG